MQRQAKQPESPSTQLNINLVSGVFTGTFCTGLMSPWDRALYLAVKNQRKFLLSANFTKPYQGLSQAMMQRALFGGVYYVAQGQIRHDFYPYLRDELKLNDPTANFAVGVAAGSINGVMTNSTATIKYHCWNHENLNFYTAAKEMWSTGGLPPFIKGTRATVTRDIVFGTTYEVLRHLLQSVGQKKSDEQTPPQILQFVSNGVAAATANVTSSPFNFARSMQYATPPSQAPLSIVKILKNIWQESGKERGNLCRLSFFQHRFQVGWGTARVAVGMALGQKVFDMAREAVTSQINNKN